MTSLNFRYAGSMRELRADEWDALAPQHVFTRHAWLSAFEHSGLVGPRAALEYRIPVLTDAAGRMVAAAPAVLKREPLAEYGPENLWLRQARENGVALLPKLQLEVPLTPVATPSLLVRPGMPQDAMRTLLLKAVLETTQRGTLAGITIARMAAADEPAAASPPWFRSREVGTRWHNEGYESFDEFLARLKTKYRYDIRRERSDFRALGLTVKELRGTDIRTAHWDAFWSGYQAVCRRNQAPALLNRAFFDALAPLGDAIRLNAVFSGDRYMSGAFVVDGGDVLFSRNWSEVEYTPAAAFEAGIYRVIESAIEAGSGAMDCGVWGPHKPKRGLAPLLHVNAHWLRDPQWQQAARVTADRHQRGVQALLARSWKERYMRGGSGARG